MIRGPQLMALGPIGVSIFAKAIPMLAEEREEVNRDQPVMLSTKPKRLPVLPQREHGIGA